MSAYIHVCRNHAVCWVLSVFWFSFCFSGDAFGTDSLQQNVRSRIVVLDPGHGGHHTGATGSENLLEKHVVMTFSRILAKHLRKRHKVLLTRTDDYDVSLEDRLAKSNHARADLFISIHTGGSLLHNLGGMSIFYHKKPPAKGFSPEVSFSAPAEPERLDHWEYVKPIHIERSRYFSELLKMQLQEDQKDLKIIVAGVPLLIAAGADMPAVLIEIGYITNPGDAQSLKNTEILNSYAKSIVAAVDAFFSDKLHL